MRVHIILKLTNKVDYGYISIKLRCCVVTDVQMLATSISFAKMAEPMSCGLGYRLVVNHASVEGPDPTGKGQFWGTYMYLSTCESAEM